MNHFKPPATPACFGNPPGSIACRGRQPRFRRRSEAFQIQSYLVSRWEASELCIINYLRNMFSSSENKQRKTGGNHHEAQRKPLALSAGAIRSLTAALPCQARKDPGAARRTRIPVEHSSQALSATSRGMPTAGGPVKRAAPHRGSSYATGKG